MPIGGEPSIPPLPDGVPTTGRQALEEIVARGLARPPCLVSFSGGRDSSAVLALAVHVARRDGWPDPIPATNRFAHIPAADETRWQELMIGHLGLADWCRLDFADELDVLGPVATQVLRRHGVLVPFNSHFQVPALERAAGGSLLTGVGGDEVFEPTQRAILGRLRWRTRTVRRRHTRALLAAVAPRERRVRAIAGVFLETRMPWLRPGVQEEIADRMARWHDAEPIAYDRSLREWWWRTRQLQCNLAGKRTLARDHDVAIHNPFADPEFLAAYAADRGRLGPPGRLWALRELFADVLPPEMIERDTFGSFNGAFWTETARRFVRTWNGEGVDTALVDPEALRREWSREDPDWHTFTLAQLALLAAEPASG
jgi:asparagine synthase (glutamine-hydrolysing)